MTNQKYFLSRNSKCNKNLGVVKRRNIHCLGSTVVFGGAGKNGKCEKIFNGELRENDMLSIWILNCNIQNYL